MRVIGRILAVVLMTVVFCIGSAIAQSNWDVRPGQGVGPLNIGMNIKQCEQIVQRNPEADHAFVGKKRPFWIYYLNGVQINYDNSASVYQIYIDKPGIVTSKGIQVGDPQSKFIAAYGKKYLAHELPTATNQPKQSFYAYKSLGLGFQVENEVVKFIAVFPPHQ
ncbi:MAG: hypothetical protein ACI38Q_01065 [Candidatus Bruticola sp.]